MAVMSSRIVLCYRVLSLCCFVWAAARQVTELVNICNGSCRWLCNTPKLKTMMSFENTAFRYNVFLRPSGLGRWFEPGNPEFKSRPDHMLDRKSRLELHGFPCTYHVHSSTVSNDYASKDWKKFERYCDAAWNTKVWCQISVKFPPWQDKEADMSTVSPSSDLVDC